jgi:hypothetical protein
MLIGGIAPPLFGPDDSIYVPTVVSPGNLFPPLLLADSIFYTPEVFFPAGMGTGIVFHAMGTPADQATGATITPALPTYIPGDLLIAVAASKGGSSVTFPSGWLGYQGISDGGYLTYVYYKIAGSSETPPTITWGSSVPSAAVVMSYSGTDQVVPLDAGNYTQAGFGSANPHNSQSVTTRFPFCVEVYVDVTAGNTATPLTVPTGYTSRLGVTLTTSGYRIDIGDKTFANPGLVPGISANGATGFVWEESVIVLNPTTMWPPAIYVDATEQTYPFTTTGGALKGGAAILIGL